MKIKILSSIIILALVYSSCGNVKEKKKLENNGNVENVNSYNDPIENETLYDDTVSYNSFENTEIAGEDDFSGFVSDSIDENENAISENTEPEIQNESQLTTEKESEPTTESIETENTNVSNITTTNPTASSEKTNKYIDYKTFYIVAGSFKDLKKAQGLNKQFNKEGVKSYISGPINGYHRVIVGKYTQKKSSLLDLTKYRKRYHKLRFWLLGEL